MGALASTEGRLFVLEGTGYSGHVFASLVVSHEDTGEYYDESALLSR